jgi:hypothetical protein
VRVSIGLIWLRLGYNGMCCEHDNGSPGPTKRVFFFDSLSNFQLHMKGFRFVALVSLYTKPSLFRLQLIRIEI